MSTGFQVLIVDDDPWILKMVTTVLAKRGYRVVTASDGQEAYARAVELRPDLIVTDIMMPKMDGWTLVRSLRMRAELAMTPVIFLSALGSDEDRIQGFRLGADDFLPKPFRFEELDLRVANALRKRQAMAGANVHQTGASLPPVSPPAHRAVTPPPMPPMAGNPGNSGSAYAYGAKAVPSGAVTPPIGLTPVAGSPPPGGIQGQLEQLGLSSLLVMVEMERKSGILVLRRETRVGRIFVRSGKVTAARVDGERLRGPEAVYDLLTWPDGRFDFNTMEVDMDDEMKGMSTQFLLMEGARLIDEAAAGKR